MTFPARALALHLARRLSDKDGQELAVYELPPGHALCDYCLVVTGRSERQVDALVAEALRFCKRHGVRHQPLEGEAGWKLLDCTDVVVHALSAELRDFYRLDRLWPGARTVDVERELAGLPDPDRDLRGARVPADADEGLEAEAEPEA